MHLTKADDLLISWERVKIAVFWPKYSKWHIASILVEGVEVCISHNKLVAFRFYFGS